MNKINKVQALEILDSRGMPTVKARVTLKCGVCGEAAVPSGASTGIHEALELRDGDKQRYGGKGVLKAVENVEKIIGPAIRGVAVTDQEKIDKTMINLGPIGANAILAVSLACARAGAVSEGKELYQYLREQFFQEEKGWQLPRPMLNVLNGGKHAIGSVDMQEFMIVPKGETFNDQLRIGTEIYQDLKKILLTKKLPIGVGDEGGFTASFKQNSEALEILTQTAGIRADLALDPAASEFFQDRKYNLDGKSLSTTEMIELYAKWVEKYPIVSIEDGLGEDDWSGWQLMTKKLSQKIQIVGDDLYVTNVKRLERGIKEKASNAILIKLNQIGTLTETIQAIKLAKQNKMAAIVSHRSGETEDAFIADLAVAANTGQIKAGAPCRSERLAKYNRLLEIETQLTK